MLLDTLIHGLKLLKLAKKGHLKKMLVNNFLLLHYLYYVRIFNNIVKSKKVF